MKCIRNLASVALLSISAITHAGFYGNTAHSRGNCWGFNESITWNWSAYHWWEVESLHFKMKGTGPATHMKKVGMAYTWRAAAYDFWNDPAGMEVDWYWVQGYHYYMGNNGARVFDVYTESGDCSGYDGWWDYPVAKGE